MDIKSRSSTPDYLDSDLEELNPIVPDGFVFQHHPQQKLNHLNKSRPKRSNVTKPSNYRNPQHNSKSTDSLFNSHIQLKPLDLGTDSCAKTFDSLDFSPRLKTNLIDQPKISIEELDKVKLRRTLNPRSISTNRLLNASASSRQINRNSTCTLEYEPKAGSQPLHLNRESKIRNRMSMFEPQPSYLAEPAHTPIPYLEIFNLENPKFDQNMLQKQPQLDTTNAQLRKPAQRQFRNIEACFSKPIYTEDTVTRAARTRQREIELDSRPHPSPRLNLPAIDPIVIEPIKQPVMKSVTQISVKPNLKNTVDHVLEPEVKTLSSQPPPVKMRTKKLNVSNETEAKPSHQINKINSKFSNRFSMFEPSCQKTYNTRIMLTDLRQQMNFNEEGSKSRSPTHTSDFSKKAACVDYDVIPRSIKDRIKMFSQ